MKLSNEQLNYASLMSPVRAAEYGFKAGVKAGRALGRKEGLDAAAKMADDDWDTLGSQLSVAIRALKEDK